MVLVVSGFMSRVAALQFEYAPSPLPSFSSNLFVYFLHFCLSAVCSHTELVLFVSLLTMEHVSELSK